MNRIIKQITAITLILCVLATVCACGNGTSKVIGHFDTKACESILSDTVATNESYELLWDNDSKCVMLKDKNSEKIWSNIPYEYMLSGGTSTNVNSTLNITVSDAQTLKWNTVNGFQEAFLDGRINGKKIDNGIEVTYYFDKYKISVPVCYRLREDSLEISVDPKKICEEKDFLIVSVSPAPFICSTPNSNDKESYLFIPTGSGALMYTDERTDGVRSYSGELYGEDASRMLTEASRYEEPIRLPVYGVCDHKNALFAIIESGAESALLDAASGNDRSGYSNVYASYCLRGYDKVHSGIQSLNYEDIIKVSANISTTPIRVAFYPLAQEDADYTGMARCYRKYLKNQNMLCDNDMSDISYGVNIYGGTLVESTNFGMPGKKLDVMTDFTQVKAIVEKLVGLSDVKPEVLLSGFGDGGVNPGKIAGGYDFDKAYGNEKSRKALEDYCAKQGINLFTDYDLIRFSSSGDGVNYTFDSAKSASLQVVEKSPVQIPLYSFDDRIEYHLLKRSKLQKVIDKLLESADKNSVSGIGLSSLGSIAYSDYTDEKYYSKGNMASDVSGYISQVQGKKHKVAVSYANAYAGAVCDVIYNAPADNGNYTSFDENIPFYEMVFVGSKPVYSVPVNTAADIRQQTMLSLSSGSRLSFDLVYDFNVSDLAVQSERFYSAVYKYNESLIRDTVKQYEAFYKLIASSSIKDYEILENGISKTVFDNGVSIYANHSAKTVNSPVGELEAYGVKWSK